MLDAYMLDLLIHSLLGFITTLFYFGIICNVPKTLKILKLQLYIINFEKVCFLPEPNVID